MKKSRSWMLFVTSLLMPTIGMLYLYNKNMQYLMLNQVLVLMLALLVIGAAGYGMLKAIFRCDWSAFGGCTVAWIAFFAFRSFVGTGGMAYLRLVIVYAIVTIVSVFAVALVIRLIFGRRGGDALPTILFFMACLLLVVNAVPTVYTTYVESVTKYAGSVYKEDFQVDETGATPSVYWFHVDGMLGFDAMEKYFGDAQAEFLDALAQRGFEVNRSAWLEAAHTTQLAVPALLCPAFYDSKLREELDGYAVNRKFTYNTSVFRRNARLARVKNETQNAFKQRGYTTQTISILGTYFPLTSDKFYYLPNDELYSTLGNVKPWIVSLGDYSEEKYLSLMHSHELASLLLQIKDGYYDLLFRLSASGLIDVGLERRPLDYDLDEETVRELLLGSTDAEYYALMLRELNDALHTDAPTFTIICDMMAHSPFLFDENGNFTGKEPRALENYPAQHRYAAKVLVNMIDMILEKDPNAVIVLQSDHGLHVQTAEEITQKLGADAVVDVWNQVTSAVRVPENLKNADFAQTMRDPRNIARWLVNTFVGTNYEYVA